MSGSFPRSLSLSLSLSLTLFLSFFRPLFFFQFLFRFHSRRLKRTRRNGIEWETLFVGRRGRRIDSSSHDPFQRKVRNKTEKKISPPPLPPPPPPPFFFYFSSSFLLVIEYCRLHVSTGSRGRVQFCHAKPAKIAFGMFSFFNWISRSERWSSLAMSHSLFSLVAPAVCKKQLSLKAVSINATKERWHCC